jgi:uncharacterized damage-inducible protein DinB
MDPVRTYDYLMLARGKVLDWCRPLGDEAWSKQFTIGLGSLSRTLTHVMICEWAYVERIQGHDVPPYEQWAYQDERPPALAELESVWRAQASTVRVVLGAVTDWDREMEYRVEHEGKKTIINATRRDIFTQLCFHEVHHRAQAMNMLRHLGVAAEDLDYNALMYRRRPG